MSGKSYASGSVRSCGGAGSVRLGASGASAGDGHEVVLDALYDRKRDKKTVRVLTVIVYVFCVSLAAIMLSLYYVFFWEPKDAQYAQRKVLHNVERQSGTTPMPTCFTPHTGGGDSTVNALEEPTPVNTETSLGTETTGTDASADFSSNSSAPLDTTPAFPSTNIEDFNGNNDTSVT